MSKMTNSNLNAMTYALKSIVSCESLGSEESFQGTCFGHAFSKACQYGITKEKVCKCFHEVCLNIFANVHHIA
jgi:hypothetical protein